MAMDGRRTTGHSLRPCPFPMCAGSSWAAGAFRSLLSSRCWRYGVCGSCGATREMLDDELATLCCTQSLTWRPFACLGSTENFCFARASSPCLFSSPISSRGDEARAERSEEHTSELQSHLNVVCRLLPDKQDNTKAA